MARRDKVITLDQLSAEVQDILAAYGKEVATFSEKDVKTAAEVAQIEVAKRSPISSGSGGHLGHYRHGWEIDIRPGKLYGEVQAEVYNAKKPGLVHLLEKGHAKRGGNGRVRGIKHVAPAQERANKTLELLLVNHLKGVE